MKGRWRKPKEFYLTNEFFISCVKSSTEIIQTFFKNNKYLLKKHSIAGRLQLRQLDEKGIKIHSSSVLRLSKGQVQYCNIIYMLFFCEYWGISLSEMITYDMEERDKMMNEAK